MDTYEHRQFSPWLLATLGVVAFLEAPGLCKRGKPALPALPWLGFAFVALQFSVLKTRVDDDGLSWGFGFGFPSGGIAFNEIAGVELTKTTFLEGYGIHWTMHHGWLWNAAGRDAVKIHKRDGRIVTLGSDDAQSLYDAIRRRLDSARQ